MKHSDTPDMLMAPKIAVLHKLGCFMYVIQNIIIYWVGNSPTLKVGTES